MTGYNGWTNWETWQIPLWIDNEEPLYRAKVAFLKPGPNATQTVDADTVRSFVLEIYPSGTPDMSAGDMARVNWAEIAEHWQEEANE